MIGMINSARSLLTRDYIEDIRVLVGGVAGGDSTDDHEGSYAEFEGLLNSLFINLTLFFFFILFFECNRHLRGTYLKRLTKKFKVC